MVDLSNEYRAPINVQTASTKTTSVINTGGLLIISVLAFGDCALSSSNR